MGPLFVVGMENSVITPAVVMRPILFFEVSVNHIAPSGPLVIPSGNAATVGSAYSVTVPLVVVRPTLLMLFSVNHNAPSGPLAISNGMGVYARHCVFFDRPGGGDSPDFLAAVFGEPERPVGSCGDALGRAAGGESKFGDRSGTGDAADFVAGVFGKPDRSVGSGGNAEVAGRIGGNRELRDAGSLRGK